MTSERERFAGTSAVAGEPGGAGEPTSAREAGGAGEPAGAVERERTDELRTES
jgi:hypothetical protein